MTRKEYRPPLTVGASTLSGHVLRVGRVPPGVEDEAVAERRIVERREIPEYADIKVDSFVQ